MGNDSYLDFAENDRNFFADTYADGYKTSAQGALAQNICERYLKHIIDTYAMPENETESAKKDKALKTHSLKYLTCYVKDDMGIPIPEDTKNALNAIDGFYFSMCYPGTESYFASDEDIDTAHIAVEKTREFTQEVMREHDKTSKAEHSQTIDVKAFLSANKQERSRNSYTEHSRGGRDEEER